MGEFLKSANPRLLVVHGEPASSSLLRQGWSGEHGIAGIGANFVPPLLNRGILHRTIAVTDEDAKVTMERLGECRFVPLIAPGEGWPEWETSENGAKPSA